MDNKVTWYLMPILKLILFVVCAITCAIPFEILKLLPFIKNMKSEDKLLVTEITFSLATLGALYLLRKIFRSLTLKDFFLSKTQFFKGFYKGTLLGFGIMVLGAIILWLAGKVNFVTGHISIYSLFFYLLFFLIVAFAEELFFRTYALFVLSERYHLSVVLIINGGLFGLLHLTNPGFTWVAMLNISLAGILFSIVTLKFRNLNWAVGIHFGWNFTQGVLLGYRVSGINTPGLLIANPIGPDYLSGGTFGIEGSIVCSILLLIVISFLLIKYKIDPIEHEFTRTR